MINKKRLAMIAVAASMVLPTNLTYLSVVTPIFAEEVTPTATLPTDTNEDGEIVLPKDTSYNIAEIQPISGNITYILDGNTITFAKSGFALQDGATLTIKGTGTIEAKGPTAIGLVGKATLRVEGDEPDSIVIKSKNATVSLFKNDTQDATDSEVTLSNVKLESTDSFGVNVNGNIDSTNTKLTLENVTIESDGPCIYQAGVSDITATNCNLTSKRGSGIETRAGNLTVSGGTIKGSSAGPLESEANSNGTTSMNAGIAIAQHTTKKPINVEIKDDARVEGYAALAITDPQNNQAEIESDKDDNITINVGKATLSGDTYDVAYTEDTIKFKLDGTTVDENKIKKLDTVEVDVENADGTTTKVKDLAKDKDGNLKPLEKDPTDLPYIYTPPAPTPVYSGSGGNKKPSKPKPEEPAEEPTTPVSTPTSMYRLYNKLTGEHLYTIDKKERDNLLTSDTWKDEGEGWIAPSVSDYPVYRLLNPNNGDHHYTTDKNEFDTLPSLGWVAEGVAFFSADKNNAENVLLHRVYNPNATGAGSHHYTTDTNERDSLVAQGWTYEGLAWAGLPANK